jgi:gliding motility-associated-like protein
VETYDIEVTGTSANYTITFVNGVLSVTPKDLIVTAENKSKVYGEANPVFTLAYEGLVNGETLIPDLSVYTSANSASSIGSYPIEIVGSSPNYMINMVNGILRITPKPITVTANNQTKRYNEADPVLSYTINPVMIGKDILTGGLSREPGENTGKYLIQQNTLKATSNYNLSFITGELTIENSSIEGVIFRDRTVTYDGNKHSLSVDNLPSGAKVVYNNNEQSNAGTYTVTATITQENFDNLVLSQVLTILKADAIIHADHVQTHVYDGNVKNIQASLNHSETTLIYSQQQGYLEAGNYEVAISSIETNNYLAASKKVQLLIQQANFEGLVLKDKEFTYDGKSHSLILENLPKESIVEYTGNDQTDAGSYTVIARVVNPNFKETTLSSNLLIKKAKQQIIFDEVGILTRNANRVGLKVSTNSGLPITVNSDDNLVASINGNELLVHRLGTTRLTASQLGDKNYEAANPVTIVVQVIDEVLGQINVHKALSPNGDGINDFLIIEGIKDYPENKLQILNRNGILVFEVENYDNALNTFQGISNTRSLPGNLPIGTYFYLLKYKDKGEWKTKQGWFVMRR